MTSSDEAYRDAVGTRVSELLPGSLDTNGHRPVVILDASPVLPEPGRVLAVDVRYTSGGQDRMLRYDPTSWEDFTDGSVEGMAQAVATMIRIEIREMFDTGEVV